MKRRPARKTSNKQDKCAFAVSTRRPTISLLSSAQPGSRLARSCAHRLCLALVTLAIAMLAAPIAQDVRAERLENKTAVFAALDKVTARIKQLEVPLNETIDFGALKITPRVCYSRPATERPKTTSFVEVTELELDGSEKKLFTGWMFAESPGLNAVEHPVFDVWLTTCKEPIGGRPVATGQTGENVEGDLPPPRQVPRRRFRR
ncbi:MAG: DUF2155 domain-containing protein [Pseudomonadota bacterium]